MKKIDRWLGFEEKIVLNFSDFKSFKDLSDYLDDKTFIFFEMKIPYNFRVIDVNFDNCLFLTDKKVKLDIIHLEDRAGYKLVGEAIYE